MMLYRTTSVVLFPVCPSQARMDVEMLTRFDEIAKHDDPCPFPFLFSYGGKNGVATDSADEALRLVLIQAGISRFNDLQMRKSANVKKELSEVFMTLALASKVCGAQLQPEHNPPAVRMNLTACVALLLEINVYHYVVYVKESSDLDRLLGIQRNVGHFIKEIKQAELPKAWLSWVERVQTWHRRCLALLKALEYYKWATSSPPEVESSRIADSLLEAQCLLREAKCVDALLSRNVGKELSVVGWVHKRSPDFKPRAWNSIISGNILVSIPEIPMWSKQVMTLSGQMLTDRIFGDATKRYMKDASSGANASSGFGDAAASAAATSLGGSARGDGVFSRGGEDGSEAGPGSSVLGCM
mgnify:FL=1